MVNCPECNNVLGITKSTQKYKKRFCNRKCASKFRSFGENKDLIGGYIRKDGYHYIKVNGKKTLYHRVLMERHLGKKLKTIETVHHINGIRNDNRIENLMVVNYKNHPSETSKIIKTLKQKIRELEDALSRKGR